MLVDYPIKSATDDLLRRTPLAKSIASLISDFKGDQSFVIGIDGAWGSGKTSFINLILEQLQGNSDILLIDFNPWNFSGQNELIEDFFNSLITAVKEISKNDVSYIQKIRDYSSKLSRKSEFSFEPEISFLGLFKLKAGQLRKFGSEKSLQESRKLVDNLLRKLGKKIVIVIDDTDRLDVAETKLIFKLVKMTANFPNTIFILAYAREKVAEKINEKGLSGEEYLTKIIQINFRLPQVDKQDLHRILFQDISESIKDIDENKWDQNRWNILFHSGFKDFFKTVRDVKRYVNSLRLDFSIVGKNEVNPIDFLGIEIFRVFAPNIYTLIGDNRTLFAETGSLYGGTSSVDHQTSRKNAIDKIIESWENSDLQGSLMQIVKDLFPQINGLYGNTYYGNEWQTEWRKNLRVASRDIFDRYFKLNTPARTVSEEYMKILIDTLSQIEAFIENLKTLGEEGKLRNALTRILDYLDNLDENQKKNLVIALMNFGDEVEDERVGIFDIENVDTLIERLVYRTVQSLPKERRFIFLQEMIEKTNSVYTSAQVIYNLLEESKTYAEKKSSREPLIDETSLNVLKPLLVERFKKAAEDSTLLKMKHSLFVLFRWKEWESENDLRVFIDRTVEIKKGLVEFLSTFVTQVFSTEGNYKTLNKKTIDELYDLQKIEKLVANISNQDLMVMNESEKELLELFRNPPKTYLFS